MSVQSVFLSQLLQNARVKILSLADYPVKTHRSTDATVRLT